MTNAFFNGMNQEQAQAQANNNPNNKVSPNGVSDRSIAISEMAGIAGGILGGLAVYGETKNMAAGVGGALVGGICGYGMGNMLSLFTETDGMGVGVKIVTGTVCASFGISAACMGGSIIAALTGSSEE